MKVIVENLQSRHVQNVSVLFATCYRLLWNDKSATRHRISAYIYYVTGHRIPARALIARRNVHFPYTVRIILLIAIS